ncbi:MAG: type II secretion system F family protein [Candidatus Aerophobetes bacterium]|nr:type II secretion system F family protein [Candidatus Aerophobetes bacterium]
MAIYSYIAVDQSGKRRKEVMEAENERAAIAQLRLQKLIPLSIKKRSKPLLSTAEKSTSQIKIFKPRVKGKDIIIFFRQFATLINAGLPMVQALDIMIIQSQNVTLKEIVGEVKKDVEAGISLSEALAKHPKTFSSLSRNMVKAGEMGGVIDVVLLRLADYLEYAESIKQRMSSAMRYPLFILFMAGGLVGVLLFAVLPKMETLFKESLHTELPALTQFILTSSNVARQKFYLILIIVGAILLFYYFIKKKEKGSYILDKVKLKLPVMGKLFHEIALSRFARTLATLSDSGVPILDSLQMTGEVGGNKVIEKATAEAKSSLKEGETIAAPLKKYSVFPPMVTSMISVGEETGALDEMLNKIADFYDREIEAMVNSLASLIEPLLIIFLGVTVGIVVVAMYLPYFTMFQHIG